VYINLLAYFNDKFVSVRVLNSNSNNNNNNNSNVSVVE